RGRRARNCRTLSATLDTNGLGELPEKPRWPPIITAEGELPEAFIHRDAYGSRLGLVELEADAGRQDHMELPPPPALDLHRTDAGGDGPVLIVESIQVADADAEAGILCPCGFAVFYQVQLHLTAPNTRHAARPPCDGEPELVGVERQSIREIGAGGHERSDREEDGCGGHERVSSLPGKLPQGELELGGHRDRQSDAHARRPIPVSAPEAAGRFTPGREPRASSRCSSCDPCRGCRASSR